MIFKVYLSNGMEGIYRGDWNDYMLSLLADYDSLLIETDDGELYAMTAHIVAYKELKN